MKLGGSTRIAFAYFILSTCSVANASGATFPSLEIYFIHPGSPVDVRTTSPPLYSIKTVSSVRVAEDQHSRGVEIVELMRSDAEKLLALVAHRPERIWVLLRGETISAYQASWDEKQQSLRLQCRGDKHHAWTEHELRMMIDSGAAASIRPY